MWRYKASNKTDRIGLIQFSGIKGLEAQYGVGSGGKFESGFGALKSTLAHWQWELKLTELENIHFEKEDMYRIDKEMF